MPLYGVGAVINPDVRRTANNVPCRSFLTSISWAAHRPIIKCRIVDLQDISILIITPRIILFD